MAKSVIDASALCDAFIARSPAEARLLKAFSAESASLDLIAPDLIFPETANALRKIALRRDADRAVIDRFIGRLHRLPIISVRMQRLLPMAWALRGTMRIQDAMYAALAQEAKLPLMTSDRRLANAAIAAGVTVLITGSEALDVFLSALGA